MTVFFAQHKRMLLGIILVILGVTLAACAPGSYLGPDGKFHEVKSVEEWEQLQPTIAAWTQQAIEQSWTPTPTFTPTITPTPTATSTPLPSPTPTPLPVYVQVNNRTGEVVRKSEYPVSCSGEWGMPGTDVYYETAGGPFSGGTRSLVCSTPWNQPQNKAVEFAKSLWPEVGYLVVVLIVIGFLANQYMQYRITTQAVERLMPNQRERGGGQEGEKTTPRGGRESGDENPRQLPAPRMSIMALMELVEEHDPEHGAKFAAMVKGHARLNHQYNQGIFISAKRAREILDHYNPDYAATFVSWMKNRQSARSRRS